MALISPVTVVPTFTRLRAWISPLAVTLSLMSWRLTGSTV